MLQAVVVRVIIFVSAAATGQVHLSSSETQVCPGEKQEVTCTVYNGDVLQWRTSQNISRALPAIIYVVRCKECHDLHTGLELRGV